MPPVRNLVSRLAYELGRGRALDNAAAETRLREVEERRLDALTNRLRAAPDGARRQVA